jgi:hypothetical protein
MIVLHPGAFRRADRVQLGERRCWRDLGCCAGGQPAPHRVRLDAFGASAPSSAIPTAGRSLAVSVSKDADETRNRVAGDCGAWVMRSGPCSTKLRRKPNPVAIAPCRSIALLIGNTFVRSCKPSTATLVLRYQSAGPIRPGRCVSVAALDCGSNVCASQPVSSALHAVETCGTCMAGDRTMERKCRLTALAAVSGMGELRPPSSPANRRSHHFV